MNKAANVMAQPAKPPKSAWLNFASFSNTFTKVFGGSLLTHKYVLKQIPFILYLTFLAMVYIFNNYATERMVIQIDRQKKENEIHRFEHILMKSKLMNLSSRSEVIKRLEGTGMKESVVPPHKIYLTN